ncbi:hypothetical protein AWENTII_011564 [Aspergillus wentii]
MFESATALSLLALALLLLVPIFIFPRFEGWAQSGRSSILQRFWSRNDGTSEIVSLRVYPIKSCRGMQLTKTSLRMHGLELDRRWMFVDAETREFLTIRQIPEMTLINTGLSADGDFLQLSITGVNDKVVSIPARPTEEWLTAHTSLAQVKIWDTLTDGHLYGPEVNQLFSTFLHRNVCLVYKGPTPRILQGNGAPQLLGRTQSTNFPDVQPVLIASEASIAELNSRLRKNGADAITIERFRPNIVIKGNAPWAEDSWKLVCISPSDPAKASVTRPLDIDIVARCTRCQVPNVAPETAEKHKKEPWDTLMSYRRIDEGMKYKPCFGMLSAPRNEGDVEVGMKFQVLEETNQHRYVKGF